MAFKLTKTHIAELGGFSSDISTCWTELEDITNDANEKIKAIIAEVQKKREEYAGKVADAKTFADGIMDDLGSEYEDRSERWQESERGGEVSEWIEELTDRFSEADSIETSDDLDSFEIEIPEDVSHVFDTENLNDQP